MRRAKLLAPFLGALTFVSAVNCQQRPVARNETPQSFVERSAKDEDAVIRLYYNPLMNGEGTAHAPSILMPASAQDPRLGTRRAWILYITPVDLRNVMQLLGASRFSWKESPNPKPLVVDPFDLPEPHHDSMEIAVSSSHGSAISELAAGRVCELLSNISKAVSNAKGRESLSFYRRTVYCLPPHAQGSSPRPNVY